ncbi:MAG: hypothetical protein OEV07_08220, partial [Gammaproteobacteria bacterium]|nr:hypothetical protein [Gammaproteobacteria bacterium]
MLRFRLARRLFLVVFAAIILIEFIIVIPSYHSYKSSLFGNYRELARVAASAALTHHTHDSSAIATDLVNLIASDSRLVGAVALDNNANLFVKAGESLALMTSETQPSHINLGGQTPRYEIYFSRAELGIENNIALRMDATAINEELNRFLFRILGLTLIICATAGSIV